MAFFLLAFKVGMEMLGPVATFELSGLVGIVALVEPASLVRQKPGNSRGTALMFGKKGRQFCRPISDKLTRAISG
jgi:hypothetical protein